ncbi:MAG: hypothetical protein ACOC7R_02280 [Planctomycetota bacterium]
MNNRRARSPAWALVVATGVLAAGCASPEPPAQPPLPPMFDRPSGAPTLNSRPVRSVSEYTPTPETDCAYVIRLNVFSVVVPAGAVSCSERLWHYLDEEITDAGVSAALNRNGLRVGRGERDDWPAVAALLRDLTGQTPAHQEQILRPGGTAEIVLVESQPVQRMFVFDRRGCLRGRDYPPGDNVLMLSARLNTDDPADVTIHAAPVVRVRRRLPHVVSTDEGVRLTREPKIVPVEPLEFTARVGQGHYLIIGPGVAARRATSPGQRFLARTDNGLAQEILLVITPEIFVAELPTVEP